MVKVPAPTYVPRNWAFGLGVEVLLHDDMPAINRVATKQKKIVFFIV